MKKTVAILQSNYIPWKGYFDLIQQVDEFILFDDMQYTRRDWRNRNKIKTARGLQWLTIPVKVKGRYFQAIKDTEISDPNWADQHWKTLHHVYKQAPYFNLYAKAIEICYQQAAQETHLSQVNYLLIKTIKRLLNITTTISWSMDYEIVEGKTERLVSLCQQAGATHYLSGPAAKNYVDPTHFDDANIQLSYATYTGYPEYNQLYPPFEHHVSILDLLFNVGSNATEYLLNQND